MFFSEGAQTQMGEPKIVPELLIPLNDNFLLIRSIFRIFVF